MMAGIGNPTTRVLTVLLLLALVPLAEAGREAGRVIFVEGTVMVVDEQLERREIGRGDLIHEQERIVTGPEARVQVRMTDESMLSLRGDSEYLIEAQRHDEEDQSLSAQAGSLFRGAMRKISGAISEQEPRNSSQATPTATIGIRGTVFQMVHVPEEGLEAFPGIDSGTYFMLEEGAAEMLTDVGSAPVAPGDVYYAASRDAMPVPAPEMIELFELGFAVPVDEEEEEELLALFEDDEGEGDDSREETSEAIRSTTEAQVEARLEEVAELPDFENVQALSGHHLASDGDFLVSGRLDPDEGAQLSFEGDGGERIMTGFEDESLPDVTTDSGATPELADQYFVRDADGNATSKIVWGRWAEGDYSADVDDWESPLGPWHYMAGSDVLRLGEGGFFNDEGSVDLAGTYRFDYVGGTDLTHPDLPAVSVEDGEIAVDFTRLEMNVGLGMEQEGDSFLLSGQDSLEAFYAAEGGSISLTSRDPDWNGELNGLFSGSDGEGLLASLQLQGEEQSLPHFGTLAFQREPRRTFDGAVNVTHACDEQSCFTGGAFSGAFQMSTDVNEEGIFVDAAGAFVSGPAGTTFVQLEANEGEDPAQQYAHDLGEGAGEIQWGFWEEGQYTATHFVFEEGDGGGGGEEELDSSRWQYLGSTHTMELAQVEGLTGSFEYSLLGNSGELLSTDGDILQLAESSGVTVNFDTMNMQAVLGLEGHEGTLISSFDPNGNDAITAFYEQGLTLEGNNDLDDWWGSIQGSFAGEDGEGIMSFIELNESEMEQWAGTAAFADRVEMRE